MGASKLVWNQDVLKQTVAALDKAGFRIYVHAIGNPDFYPSSNVLDAFAYARQVNGRRDSRHAITHLSWTDRSEVARFRDLGVIAVPQPVWFGKGWFVDAPKDKLPNADLLGSYFAAGVPAVASSDFPSTNTFKLDMFPPAGIEAGMTRLDPVKTIEAERLSAPSSPEQASLPQMIASYTINGAYLIFGERDVGSIEVGKRANFVVLDKNIFTVPVTSISDARVMATYFEGKEVYSASTETGQR